MTEPETKEHMEKKTPGSKQQHRGVADYLPRALRWHRRRHHGLQYAQAPMKENGVMKTHLELEAVAPGH